SFGGADGASYEFIFNFEPGWYPSVWLKRSPAEGGPADMGGGPFLPAVIPPGRPVSLSIAVADARFAAFVDGSPLLYIEGFKPAEGPVGFWLEHSAVTLDNFRLWHIGAAPGPMWATASACEMEEAPGRNALCLESPGNPTVQRAFPFNVGAAAW